MRPRHLPRRLLPCPHCGELHRCLSSWPVPPPTPVECVCGRPVLRDHGGGLWDADDGVPHVCPPGPPPLIVPVGLRDRRLVELVRRELERDLDRGRLPRAAGQPLLWWWAA